MYELHLMGGRRASAGAIVPARYRTVAAVLILAAVLLGLASGRMTAPGSQSDPEFDSPLVMSKELGAPMSGFRLDPLCLLGTRECRAPGDQTGRAETATSSDDADGQALQGYRELADRIPSDKLDRAARDRNLLQSESAQRRMASFLADRYDVDPDSMREYVAHAHDAAHLLHIDPLLILAVMAVESNYRPESANASGARGLMQVIPAYHGPELAPFGGAQALHEPRVNILVGGLVLKQYIALTGSLQRGLRYYVGASDPDTDDQGYVRKVSGELKSLRDVMASARQPVAITGAAP